MYNYEKKGWKYKYPDRHNVAGCTCFEEDDGTMMGFKIEVNGDAVNCPLTGIERVKIKKSIENILRRYRCKTRGILFYP